MRLKRVRIFGFKTFAEKTELTLDADLIAVVGPNGCGKSNIVDAILWGLGEPNARHLRAATSQDVIFAGSPGKKPLGYAEVSLLFDNEDGSLALDAPEVMISRRLTRSGDSDYRINGHACRQKDVFDLLADSGLGRSGYAIVGQREVDAALSASPMERRAWIDEAAGVQRYRMRRIEAQRRLDAARSHLERVSDLVHEIETQREPLREEAEAAQRYKSIRGSLEGIESGLLILELAKATQDAAEAEARIAKLLATSGEEAARAEKLEREAKALGDEIAELERQLDAFRELRQSMLTSLERADAARKLAEQRLESIAAFEASLNEETTVHADRVDEARKDLEASFADAKAEKEALDALHVELSGAGEDAKKLRAELAALESALNQARVREAARLRSAAERAHRADRMRAAAKELAGVEKSLPELEGAVAEASEALAGHANARKEAESAVEAARSARARLADAEEQASAGQRQVLAAVAALEGRRRGLEASLETFEGVPHGVAAVLRAAQEHVLPDAFEPVGAAIEVEPDLAIAVETALGAAVHDLICPTEDHAREAIEWLKKGRLGRATFQPLTLMRPPSQHPELRRVLGERGVVGLASQLVRCPDRVRPAIDSLLGRIVIVETLRDALDLARTQGWSRMVTLEGEVVHASGAVTGGTGARPAHGLVQRKAELGEVEREIGALRKKLEAFEKQTAQRLREDAEQRAALDRALQRLQALAPEAAEAKDWLENLQRELADTRRAGEKLRAEIAALSSVEGDAASEEQADPAEIEAQRDALLRTLATTEAADEASKQRLADAEVRLRQAQLRVEDAQRRLRHAEDADGTRQTKLRSIGKDRQAALREIDQARADHETAESKANDAKAQLDARQENKRAMLEKSFALNEDARKAHQASAACGDLIHQAELARARADGKRAAAAQRLIEDYGINEDDAMRAAPETQVPDDAAQVVGRLRRELKSLGEVNLGAIEAFQRLTERHEELRLQQEDILQGRAEVESSIRELDRLSRDRVRTAFDALQLAFREAFQKLFGGGQGELRLTNADDVLESGVELDVTVPGKRRQTLELLSGGERSMVAVAFLFALLQVRPSPLVVLDEVDAALDGRNVERFLGVLRGLAGRTQFILITHNPITIEAAPLWFGVTMQEPGVSTVVPFTMPGEALVERAPAYLKG